MVNTKIYWMFQNKIYELYLQNKKDAKNLF